MNSELTFSGEILPRVFFQNRFSTKTGQKKEREEAFFSKNGSRDRKPFLPGQAFKILHPVLTPGHQNMLTQSSSVRITRSILLSDVTEKKFDL
jgi:hypothetical protein